MINLRDDDRTKAYQDMYTVLHDVFLYWHYIVNVIRNLISASILAYLTSQGKDKPTTKPASGKPGGIDDDLNNIMKGVQQFDRVLSDHMTAAHQLEAAMHLMMGVMNAFEGPRIGGGLGEIK
jgi:hypothetical protein